MGLSGDQRWGVDFSSPFTLNIIEGAAFCRDSWGEKEKAENKHTQIKRVTYTSKEESP